MRLGFFFVTMSVGAGADDDNDDESEEEKDEEDTLAAPNADKEEEEEEEEEEDEVKEEEDEAADVGLPNPMVVSPAMAASPVGSTSAMLKRLEPSAAAAMVSLSSSTMSTRSYRGGGCDEGVRVLLPTLLVN